MSRAETDVGLGSTPPVFRPRDHDPVDHPRHYTSHPSGIECIEVTRHMSFCLGNAMKYLWRAGAKAGADPLEDLRKARWYIDDEIRRLERQASPPVEKETPPEASPAA